MNRKRFKPFTKVHPNNANSQNIIRLPLPGLCPWTALGTSVPQTTYTGPPS